MGKIIKIVITFIFLQCLLINTAFAAELDLSLSESSIHFSQETFLEGNSVRIYATVYNSSNNDLLGTVTFWDHTAGAQIGSDQTISIFANKTDDIFVDWTPYFAGQHTISITIDPWITDGDDSSNNSARKTVNVLKDTDHDGITDNDDPDDDNDGHNDEEDMFPLDSSEWVDTDGDRKGDNTDEDDDNDGVIDEADAFPLDSLESEDTDEDGEGNNKDDDDDNDGLTDKDEIEAGTNPTDNDSDDDSVLDGDDAFPLDQSEQYDYDSDGAGDHADTDDDNDGILDEEDINDHNKGPTIVIDGNKYIAFLNRNHFLSAKNSFDEDGEIKEIQWLVDEKEVKIGENFSYKFENTGSHSIKIVVLDDKDEVREIILKIDVFNFDFYLTAGLILIIILLAIIIILKYSALAEKISKFKK